MEANRSLGGLLRRCRATGSRAGRGLRRFRSLWGPPETLVWLEIRRGHRKEVTCLAMSRDGRRLASGSHDMTVRVWDVDSGAQLAVLRGHRFMVACVAITPDGRRVFSGDIRGTVRMWDASTGERLATLRGHSHGIYNILLTDDGRHVETWSADDEQRLWDVATGKCLAVGQLPGTMWVGPYLPDDCPIRLSAQGVETVVEDVVTGRRLASFPQHLSNLTASAGGRWAGSVGRHIYVFTMAQGQHGPENIRYVPDPGEEREELRQEARSLERATPMIRAHSLEALRS